MTNPDNHPDEHSEVNQPEPEHTPYRNEYAYLTGEVGRMLAELRRAYANLVAACRAALSARRDGEPYPWRYIEDELPPPPPGHPLHRPYIDTDRVGGGW